MLVEVLLGRFYGPEVTLPYSFTNAPNHTYLKRALYFLMSPPDATEYYKVGRYKQFKEPFQHFRVQGTL